jgi:hypothetical protein
MDNLEDRCKERGRRAVLFAASRFSSVHVPRDREVLQVRVRHSAVRVISAVDHIPPVLPAPVSRRVQEWAERRDCRLQACPPSQPDAQARLLAVRDNVISTDPKKAR